MNNTTLLIDLKKRKVNTNGLAELVRVIALKYLRKKCYSKLWYLVFTIIMVLKHHKKDYLISFVLMLLGKKFDRDYYMFLHLIILSSNT